MGLFKRKKECPKCDSQNIKTLKAGFWARNNQKLDAFWTGGGVSKPLNVCRDCGFSWEDR